MVLLVLKRGNVLIILVLLTQLIACDRVWYSPLVYIEFRPSLYNSNWLELRDLVNKTLSQDCQRIVSNVDKKSFYDRYLCDTNLYVLAGVYSVSVSFEDGQTLSTRAKAMPRSEKWKPIAKKLWEAIYPKWTNAYLGRHIFEIKDGFVSHVRHDPSVDSADIFK